MPFTTGKLINALFPVLDQYNVNTVYLFGSRSDGTNYPESDYDLGILFQDFPKQKQLIDFQMEVEDILEPAPVDIIFLQKAPVEMRYQVIKTGRIIFCRDDDFRTDFEDIAMRDYLDLKPFLDQYRREVEEALREGNFFA